MLKYILKRILMVIPVLLGVTVIIFLITRVLAPDPAPVVLGEHATTEAMAAWRADNGLDDPYDAYEWSFVAVPAQREAGVIKMYTPTDTEEGTRTNSDIIKAFSEGKEMTLSPEECAEISGCLRELAKKAEAGEAYERELRQEVVRLSLLSQPGVPKDIMERVAKRMTLEQQQEKSAKAANQSFLKG